MPRLPIVASDGNAWGTVLNEYLTVSHNAEGTLKDAALGNYLAKAGGTLTGLLTSGAGDALGAYVVAPAMLGDFRHGTAAAPLATAGVSLRAARTMALTQAALVAAGGGGDGVDYAATLAGVNVGTAANEVQAVGVLGAAKSSSITVAHAGGDDACGVYGAGRITGAGTGTGMGAFLIGRRDNNTGVALGAEVHAANYGTADAAYNSAGFAGAMGLWLNAGGDFDSAAAIVISNAFGRQFEVGLGFTAQVAGAKTGGARMASVRDDGNAFTSLLINGAHSTAAIAIAAGSGRLLVGRVAQVRASIVEILAPPATGALDVQGSGGNALVARRNDGTSIFFANEGGVTLNNALPLILSEGSHLQLGTTTGTKIGTAATQKLAIWNATPIVQPVGIVDADGTLIDITTKFNSLIGKLESFGLLAVA